MVTARPWAALVLTASAALGASAQTTINDALIITEFFEDFRLVDPVVPSATPLFQSASNAPGVPGITRELLLEPAGTLLFGDQDALRRYDPATGIITDVNTTLNFGRLAMESDGSVIGIADGDVYRVDPVTGQATVFFNDETFYSPRNVTVAPNGDIYVNEFFDSLIRIDPVTSQFTVIPTDIDYAIAKIIEALPSGDLAFVTFGDELFIFDPGTGVSTPVPLSIDLPSPNGSAIGTDGQLLLTSGDAVHAVDVQTGVVTELIEITPFFTPFDVVQGTVTIPEPASAGLLLAGLGLVGRRRR